MKNSSVVAIAALAGASGYCLGKQLNKLTGLSTDTHRTNIPFINDFDLPENFINRAIYNSNPCSRDDKEAEIVARLSKLMKTDFSDYSDRAKKGIQPILDDIIADLISLGYVVNIDPRQRDFLAKYTTPARRDLAKMLSHNPDYRVDCLWLVQPDLFVSAAANLITRNVKKNIFPDIDNLLVTLFARLLPSSDTLACIYTLSFLLTRTNIQDNKGWSLMLDAYRLKYALEKGVDVADLEEDRFIDDVIIGLFISEDEMLEAISTSDDERDFEIDPDKLDSVGYYDDSEDGEDGLYDDWDTEVDFDHPADFYDEEDEYYDEDSEDSDSAEDDGQLDLDSDLFNQEDDEDADMSYVGDQDDEVIEADEVKLPFEGTTSTAKKSSKKSRNKSKKG